MDGFMAEFIAGIFGVVLALITGIGVLFKMLVKEMKGEVRSLKSSQDRGFAEMNARLDQFLPRDQHQQAQQKLLDGLAGHASHLLRHDDEISELKARVVKLERKQ